MTRNETYAMPKLHSCVKASVAAVLLPMAVCGDACAAGLIPETGSAGHAALLFVIAWLLASLRIRRVEGRWRFGFELSPMKGLSASGIPSRSAEEGKRP